MVLNFMFSNRAQIISALAKVCWVAMGTVLLFALIGEYPSFVAHVQKGQSQLGKNFLPLSPPLIKTPSDWTSTVHRIRQGFSSTDVRSAVGTSILHTQTADQSKGSSLMGTVSSASFSSRKEEVHAKHALLLIEDVGTISDELSAYIVMFQKPAHHETTSSNFVSILRNSQVQISQMFGVSQFGTVDQFYAASVTRVRDLLIKQRSTNVQKPLSYDILFLTSNPNRRDVVIRTLYKFIPNGDVVALHARALSETESTALQWLGTSARLHSTRLLSTGETGSLSSTTTPQPVTHAVFRISTNSVSSFAIETNAPASLPKWSTLDKHNQMMQHQPSENKEILTSTGLTVHHFDFSAILSETEHTDNTYTSNLRNMADVNPLGVICTSNEMFDFEQCYQRYSTIVFPLRNIRERDSVSAHLFSRLFVSDQKQSGQSFQGNKVVLEVQIPKQLEHHASIVRNRALQTENVDLTLQKLITEGKSECQTINVKNSLQKWQECHNLIKIIVAIEKVTSELQKENIVIRFQLASIHSLNSSGLDHLSKTDWLTGATLVHISQNFMLMSEDN